MKLHWGFYKDAWLIDPFPEVFPIYFEEHPNGWRINPEKITVFFGANPEYVWGTGKLYHEVIFGDLGFVALPFFYDRPGIEFLKSYKVTLAEDKDWLGNPSTIYKVGRVDVTKMIKKLITKLYGIPEDGFFQAGSPSSELVEATKEEIKTQFQTEFEPIFQTVPDLVNTLGCVWYSPMHQAGTYPIEVVSNTPVKLETPFSKIYYHQGIYKNILSLKNVRIDITDALKPIFTDDSIREFFITFKTPAGFREGTLIDYGSDSSNGFRVDVIKEGIDIYINGQKYHFAHNISFISNNAFFIYINFDEGISIDINQNIIKYNKPIPKPKVLDTDKAYISGLSKSNRYIDTGDVEEFGIFKGPVIDGYIARYIRFDPFLPIVEQKSTDSIPIVVDRFLYSQPAAVLIPSTYETRDVTKKVIPFQKAYIYNNNSSVEEATFKKLLDYDANILYIPKNYNLYKAIGWEDESFDDATDYCFMIKKISSDSHIPIRIDMEFKIPEWWNKDMELKMQLKMIPVNKMLWYSYMRFKTGDWV